ncbi:hypothetical protein LTR85_007271 [Meristemomyces frigidus]|nr:hypothetical protein LTR85_007271 [Meristemomyces frigidus]
MSDAPMLLLTVDGGDYGIRRGVEHSDWLRAGCSSVPLFAADPLTSANDEIPFRLVLNSLEMMNVLEKITEDDLPRNKSVHLRPFRYLLAYEQTIRAALGNLRAALGKAEPPDAVPQTDHQNLQFPEDIRPDVDQKIMGIKANRRNQSLLECVVNFMDVEMSDILKVRRKIRDRTVQTITFEYLSHLYTPGDLVFTDCTSPAEARRAYRVLYVTGGRPYFESQPDRKTREYDYEHYGYPGAREGERGIQVGGIQVLPEDSVSQGLQGKATRMTPLVLDCFFMDCDGASYGPRPQRFLIPEFNGYRRVMSLDVYPAQFDTEYERVRLALQTRGKKFIQHAQVDQKAALNRFNPLERHERNRVTEQNKLGFHTGVIARPTEPNPLECLDNQPHPYRVNDIYNDFSFDLDRRSRFLHNSALLATSNAIHEAQLELLPLRIFGYALQHRKWYALSIANLSDVRTLQDHRQESAFDDLVLPPKHKKTIQALVSHQVRNFKETSKTMEWEEKGAQTFDLIHNKGKGLVILLHGAPGVGKTSTAESVAIQLKRPLLPITCGDLGSEYATTVETTLEYFLGLGMKWGCVVLLDEADVFLARRVTGDLKRNSLVSIFLRQMEYYSGILILTTNRVGEFDEAFVSRIHMKLHYPALNEQSTLDIWNMNIRRLKSDKDLDMEIKAKSIRKFAEEYWLKNELHPGRQWNGRQIKNAFQTAVALASWDYNDDKAKGRRPERVRPVLKKSHFEDVAGTSLHFDVYMDKLYGAVMQNGRRGKGAYWDQAERTRIRFDDDGEVENIDPAYSQPRPFAEARPTLRGWPQVSAGSAQETKIAELERQLAGQKEDGEDSDSDSDSDDDD